MDTHAIKLTKEAIQEMEYLKEEGDEGFVSILQRALKVLYYFKKQGDLGYTQVLLRNPSTGDVRVMKMRKEEEATCEK